MVIIKSNKDKKKIPARIRGDYFPLPKKCSGKAKHEESSSRKVDNDVHKGPAFPIEIQKALDAGEVGTAIHGVLWRKRIRTPIVPKKTSTKATLGLQCTNAHVTHSQLTCCYLFKIIGLKKNPTGPMYTTLGMMPRGTIIKVDVRALGMVTPAEEEIWEKYAKVTNDPEIDGYVNADLIL